MYNVYMEVDNY